MSSVLLLSVCFLVGGYGAIDDSCVPEAVTPHENLDVSRFMGLWYERWWRNPETDDLSEYSYTDYIWRLTEKENNEVEIYSEEYVDYTDPAEGTGCENSTDTYTFNQDPETFGHFTLHVDGEIDRAVFVLQTDYDTYCITYECEPNAQGVCSEESKEYSIWSRSLDDIPAGNIATIDEVLDGQCVDKAEHMHAVRHDDACGNGSSSDAGTFTVSLVLLMSSVCGVVLMRM